MPKLADAVMHVFRPHESDFESGEMRNDEMSPPSVKSEVTRPNCASVSEMHPLEGDADADTDTDAEGEGEGERTWQVSMGWSAFSSEMP